jgi:hypothetical protein
MKIRLVGAELFHADRQTGRHDEANSRIFAILRTRLKMVNNIKIRNKEGNNKKGRNL